MVGNVGGINPMFSHMNHGVGGFHGFRKPEVRLERGGPQFEVPKAENGQSAAPPTNVVDTALENAKPIAIDDEAVAEAGDKEPTSFEDLLKKMTGGLEGLMEQMGLGGIMDGEGGDSFQYMKAQVEINYSAVRMVATENGFQAQSFNFNYSASFEYMGASSGAGGGQGMPGFDPASMGALFGNPFGGNPFGGEGGGQGGGGFPGLPGLSGMPGMGGFPGMGPMGGPGGAGGPSGAGRIDPMEKLQEYFSPEKTAERILDFALSFFPRSEAFQEGGDTVDARQQFADMMGEAVQKGFDQAMTELGSISEETQEGIDKTHELVFSGLDDFVENGYNADKQESDLYNGLQAYYQEVEVSMSYQSVSMSYDRGLPPPPPPPPPSQDAHPQHVADAPLEHGRGYTPSPALQMESNVAYNA